MSAKDDLREVIRKEYGILYSEVDAKIGAIVEVTDVTPNGKHMVGEQQEILYNQAVLANAVCILLKNSIFGARRMNGPDTKLRNNLYRRLTEISLKHRDNTGAR